MLTEAQRAALTARLRRGRENLESEIPRRPAGLADLPLSYGQEQLWFIDRFAPGLPTYNIPLVLRLTGPLDPAAVRRAIDQLTARHEPLRTRLVRGGDGRPAQVIDPAGPAEHELVDLSQFDPDKRQARLAELIDTEALRPFALADGPLLRTWLLRLTEAEHLLLVVVHHTVFDGWSIGVLVRELAALYAAEATGQPSGLDELPVQFADYALWERDRLAGPALAELEDYWHGVMDGFGTVEFPTDRPRPVVDTFDGGLVQELTAPDLLDGLRELSRREGATLFVILIASLLALLRRYTGQDDLVIGTASANRARSQTAPLIGYLVNSLPVRADLSGDPSFAELLARVREATTGAYAHQDLPFTKLVEMLGVDRDPGRAPVFQIAMTYAERQDLPVTGAGVEFVVTNMVVGIRAAKFDLTILAEARGEGLWFEFAYKTGLFDEATIRRLLGNWEVLLRGAVADPSARLSQLPVLTGAELRRELTEWNDTAADFPVRCVHEAFEARVALTPQAVAAQFELGRGEGQRLTYAQLNARANQVARQLRAAGTSTDATAGPETLVGVCMATGLDRLAAVLGIWKAGGGYVPLDPGLPADRLSFMIADTGMKVIVTDSASAASLPPAAGVTAVNLDAGRDAIGALDAANLDGTGVTPGNVAYVIYTSGSTGEPKGVVVEHRQAVNFLQGMVAPWRIGPGSVVLAFAAFTFDVSVCDMFLPLIAGGRVVLAAKETLHSPPRLTALMRDAGVTYAMLPPAVLSLLNGQDFPDLRTLISTGEELVSELVHPWLRDGLEFWNGYGPTEATMGSTFMKLDASTPLPPPIGRPKPNYRAYVLDPWLNPVPAGVFGELHIGGAGVSRGYLNRPELTKEKFIGDPFSGIPGARLYKTGDLVRRRPDGTIVFAGRIDDQVKIRGLRVELGEIETALAAHPAVAHAAVTVIADQSGEPQLAAYLRPEDGGRAEEGGRAEGNGRAGKGAPDPAELKAYLADRLPGLHDPGLPDRGRRVPAQRQRQDRQGRAAAAAGTGTGRPGRAGHAA